ncbi:MAG: hypothetical protein MZV70_73040 [Desulfobacterales bacterium]|nr:hypothetical protein [Desulfobacterales bacterium]
MGTVLQTVAEGFQALALLHDLLPGSGIVFILIFRDQISEEPPPASVASAILNGMRFDSVISTFFVLILSFSAASYFKDFEQMAWVSNRDRERLSGPVILPVHRHS